MTFCNRETLRKPPATVMMITDQWEDSSAFLRLFETYQEDLLQKMITIPPLPLLFFHYDDVDANMDYHGRGIYFT